MINSVDAAIVHTCAYAPAWLLVPASSAAADVRRWVWVAVACTVTLVGRVLLPAVWPCPVTVLPLVLLGLCWDVPWHLQFLIRMRKVVFILMENLHTHERLVLPWELRFQLPSISLSQHFAQGLSYPSKCKAIDTSGGAQKCLSDL